MEVVLRAVYECSADNSVCEDYGVCHENDDESGQQFAQKHHGSRDGFCE